MSTNLIRTFLGNGHDLIKEIAVNSDISWIRMCEIINMYIVYIVENRRKLEVGKKKSLVLLPTNTSKLLASWKGPTTIIDQAKAKTKAKA